MSKNLFRYFVVAVVFFLAGVVFSPGSVPRTRLAKKLSYTRAKAQRMYTKWEPSELVFVQNGESFDSFLAKNDTFVLYFWATWCPHCVNVRESLASLEKCEIPVIALVFDSQKEAYETYRTENPYFWHDLVKKCDDGWEFVERLDEFNIPSIPSAWIVERGKVKKVFRGEKGIAKLVDFFRKKEAE